MELLDGAYIYHFSLSDKRNIRYYEITSSQSYKKVIQEAKIDFKRRYGGKRFSCIRVKKGVKGYPLTTCKMW